MAEYGGLEANLYRAMRDGTVSAAGRKKRKDGLAALTSAGYCEKRKKEHQTKLRTDMKVLVVLLDDGAYTLMTPLAIAAMVED